MGAAGLSHRQALPAMSDLDSVPPPARDERRAELRVPASTLGNPRTRLIGGSDFSLLNYTPRSLYGESRSRLLIGARISVRLATATLNAIVTGRVVRSSLIQVLDGVPRYEVAVSLEDAVDWSRDASPADAASLDAVAVPVAKTTPAE
jgi:hypothetical protein